MGVGSSQMRSRPNRVIRTTPRVIVFSFCFWQGHLYGAAFSIDGRAWEEVCSRVRAGDRKGAWATLVTCASSLWRGEALAATDRRARPGRWVDGWVQGDGYGDGRRGVIDQVRIAGGQHQSSRP